MAVSSLRKYYMKTRNIDFGDKNATIEWFTDTQNKINILTPVLEDLTNEHIYGIEDIFNAVYGYNSDETYALQAFLDLSENMHCWNTEYMWNDCCRDHRLYRILKSIGA